MCYVCTQYALGSLTWVEALRNLREITIDDEHRKEAEAILISEVKEDV